MQIGDLIFEPPWLANNRHAGQINLATDDKQSERMALGQLRQWLLNQPQVRDVRGRTDPANRDVGRMRFGRSVYRSQSSVVGIIVTA